MPHRKYMSVQIFAERTVEAVELLRKMDIKVTISSIGAIVYSGQKSSEESFTKRIKNYPWLAKKINLRVRGYKAPV